MSIFGPFTNGKVTIAGVDLSARVKSWSISYNADMLDASKMGDLTKVNLAGLKEWSLNVDFIDDLAVSGAGSVDATLFPLVGAAAFTVAARVDAGAISTTNPEFTGLAVLAGTNIGGAHGGLLMKSGITFQCAGALDRDVTP